MLISFFNFITGFGDSAITGAFAVVMAVFFLIAKERRVAFALIAAFLLSVVLIALGKIILYSRCNALPFAFLDLGSPSGHTALSVAVYGTFAIIVSLAQTGKRRILPYLFAVPFISLIALSRVVLGFHTKGDVLIGLSTGILTCLVVWRLFLKGEKIHCRWGLLMLAGLLIFRLLGLHFPAEDIINAISEYIRGHVRTC